MFDGMTRKPTHLYSKRSPTKQRDRRRVYWDPIDIEKASAEADQAARAARHINRIDIEPSTDPIDDPREPQWVDWPRWFAPFACRCGGYWFVRRHFEGHECVTEVAR
jgi:hypothetical protein